MNKLATRRPRGMYVAVFAVVAIIVLVLDQGSKAWAKQALSDGREVAVIPRLLSFFLVHNPGASLGFGSGHTWVIAVLAIIACALLVYASAVTDSKPWAILLGAAFGGAAGNLIDRIAYAHGFLDGKVVDFINYGWSVGNVADIFLSIAGIGVVILVLCGIPFRREPDVAVTNARDTGARDADARDTDDQDASEHDRGVNSQGSESR